MFILTKPILVSLCKENWVSVYSIDKNKKVTLGLNKRASVLLEEKLGRKCPGILPTCAPAVLLGRGGKEGRQAHILASLTRCGCLPRACAWAPITRVWRAGSLQVETSLLALKGGLWWSCQWQRSCTIQRTMHSWTNFQFAGFILPPPSTCES